MRVPEPLTTSEYSSCGTRQPRDVMLQVVVRVLLAPFQEDRSTSGSTNTVEGSYIHQQPHSDANEIVSYMYVNKMWIVVLKLDTLSTNSVLQMPQESSDNCIK